jgi:hypothetical protein
MLFHEGDCVPALRDEGRRLQWLQKLLRQKEKEAKDGGDDDKERDDGEGRIGIKLRQYFG